MAEKKTAKKVVAKKSVSKIAVKAVKKVAVKKTAVKKAPKKAAAKKVAKKATKKPAAEKDAAGSPPSTAFWETRVNTATNFAIAALVEPEISSRVQAICKKRGVSVSEFVLLAIDKEIQLDFLNPKQEEVTFPATLTEVPLVGASLSRDNNARLVSEDGVTKAPAAYVVHQPKVEEEVSAHK